MRRLTWAVTTGLLASVAALGGCSEDAPNSIANGAIVRPAQADWDGFRDATLRRWFELDPAFAVYQGRHEFDGRLPDWSAAGLKAQSDFLMDAMKQARGYRSLTGTQAFERDHLISVIEGRLFWLDDADQPHRNPAFYLNNGLDPNVYVAREYADPATRMRALTKMLRGVPRAAEQIRANLRTPMPLSFVDYAVAGFGGLADYYTGDARAAFAGQGDATLHRELDAAAAAAATAMRGLRDWVAAGRDTATQDFAMGPERFARMLKATEMVGVPVDQLEAIGQADLRRNQQMLRAECARIAPGAGIPQCLARVRSEKPEDGPVAAATRQLPQLRAFLAQRDLVTIPGTEQAEVRESPPYMRQNSAYIDIPGPYETGLPSIYYISPPDPAWSPQVQADYVPSEPDLLFTSVHEVWPGHFLQFLHSNRVQSLIGRLFVGYASAEGWAHYAEEMMWEAGLRGDPATHIGQISNALLRNCRYLSAIGLHARGMTQEQSRQLFQTQCYQDEGTARQQAARGTYDPAYLNYTLGKLMIRRLRADWTGTRGGRRAWKGFHDAFLRFGGPPVPLVRQAMLGEETPRAVF